MINIAVLMTCYNRRETTLRCLERLYEQKLPDNVSYNVYLVDDGCMDGTGDAVREYYPDINVIQGDGTLFWCNGMRLAWSHAAEKDYDFYLWLNDDSMLLDGALNKLLDTYAMSEDTALIIGSCRDPETGLHSYGGQGRIGLHPAKLRKIEPGAEPVLCDTFQGNIVLISQKAFKRIGIMRSFKHAMGDTDYGYLAGKAGCSLLIAPGYIGECNFNITENMSQGSELSLMQRWHLLKKRMPPIDWFRLLWAHSGLLSLVYWPRPYLRVLLGLNR
ncbi:glycosyltransferase family 2 protein [Pontiella agarivorans]|uniref:Glycosyltransferase family 2 protein n=1 Tax=Pontiella agarivorans TaxID=3038953 RepID=A0ABU5MT25_9BACT|nr:glycosyltransferase family 2 protein [Pontiella agarivorans]MDZ8117330.1 glycosyltransferase family 2 protein [Pontiella agarivorans]